MTPALRVADKRPDKYCGAFDGLTCRSKEATAVSVNTPCGCSYMAYARAGAYCDFGADDFRSGAKDASVH